MSDHSPERHFNTTVALPCGVLSLNIDRADLELTDLCGFACRRNRKRGFLFVSKVLGKHYPVRPSVMRNVQMRLAKKLTNLEGPVVVVGLAETATGLAHGIYEQLVSEVGGEGMLFLHTTRYRFQRPLAFEFTEPHSHAPRHLVYEPIDLECRRLFHSAVTLILVDDELSTGTTLANLAHAFQQINTHLKTVQVISITDWLTPTFRDRFRQRVDLPVDFQSLLQGQFHFEPNLDFAPELPPDMTGGERFLDDFISANSGRWGTRDAIRISWDGTAVSERFLPGQRILMLGTGEFNYAPFCLASQWESAGWDVAFQSTTRSPILCGLDIASSLEFVDNYGESIPNYVYNVVDKCYDHVLIGYETNSWPARHDLPRRLHATPLIFNGSQVRVLA